MATAPVPMWLVIAFDSEIRDPREQLQVEYDGLRLHIRPSRDEFADLISVFVEPPQDISNTTLRVNRF